MSKDGLYAARGQGWPERRMSKDGLAENSSCIFCTSAVPGGRQITAPCVICTPAIPGGRMPREAGEERKM